MEPKTTSREAEILQAEIDRLHEQLTAKHDEIERLKDENRQLWADRQAAREFAASLEAEVHHLNYESKRWGAQS